MEKTSVPGHLLKWFATGRLSERDRAENGYRRYPLAEYWKTKFEKMGESFVPAVTNGIPPPIAEPAGITSGDDQVSRSEFTPSSLPPGIPETSSLEFNETGSLVFPSLTPPPASSATAVLSSLHSASLIIPIVSSNFAATGGSAAPPTLSSFPSGSCLTPRQLAAIIASCVLGSFFLVL